MAIKHQKILDQFEAELARSTPHTRQDRVFYARMFLEFAEDKPLSEWNKELVYSFLEQLKKELYADGTIRKAYGIIKRVFDAAKTVHEAERTRLISSVDTKKPAAVAEVLKAMALPSPNWDLGKRSAPHIEKEVKPDLSLEEVQRMVEVAKKGLALSEICYLALSSIYGLRRGELCAVRKEHLNFDARTIFVLTEKGGQKRDQLLCEEIIPILRGYSFETNFSDWRMSAMWWRICAAAGVNPGESSGWHNMRRYLDTALVDTVGELPTQIFLRWKLSSSSEMQLRYYTQDFLEVDQRVLSAHPVVALWR